MKVLYATNNMSRHLSICVLRESILTLVARGFVTRLTRRVSLVEQELLTLPEHQNSPSVFSGVHVTRALDLYVCFVDRGFFCCTLSFDPCVFCSSSIYGFLLPLWYFKLFLVDIDTLGWCKMSLKFTPATLLRHVGMSAFIYH
jgi:hypothetical protein